MGTESADFAYGPVAQAMMNDEELVLENSAALPVMMAAKLHAIGLSLFLLPKRLFAFTLAHFRLVLQ